MAAPTPGPVNFGTIVAPDVAAEQVAMARRQQLVDYLRKQAMDPMEQQVVTGAGPSRVVPISPFQGLTKMASAYLAGKSQDDLDAKSLDLNKQMAQRMSQVLSGAAPAVPDAAVAAPMALGEGAGKGSLGPTVANAQRMDALNKPQPAGQPAGQNSELLKLLRGNIYNELGGAPAASAYWKQYEPTDLQRNDTYLGITPEQSRTSELGKRAKEAFIPPVNARPGSILRDPLDPSKIVAFNPHIPEGGAPQFDAQGNVTGIAPITGATSVMEAAARAKSAGEGSVLPYSGFDAQGRPLPVTSRTAAATQAPAPAVGAPVPPAAPAQTGSNPYGGLPQPQPGVNGAFTGDPAAVIASIGEMKDPQERSNALAAFESQMRANGGTLGKGGIYGAAPPGYGTGQEAAQTELSKKWTDLNTANSQAQTTSSYLDNIKQLAGAAATGPFTTKLQFANALLGLVGNEKANDATTANALLDKYTNQIVSRLGGSGSLGTDAARSLLQSAYPNAHMTVDAINEAADNLKGANEMVKAKAAFLQQHAVKRDPEAYSQREVLFDQNADPRLWQLKSMDAATAKKYLSAMPPNVQADLRKRAAALKDAGVL